MPTVRDQGDAEGLSDVFRVDRSVRKAVSDVLPGENVRVGVTTETCIENVLQCLWAMSGS